jgi:Flp pilus assembly secretin CpaC
MTAGPVRGNILPAIVFAALLTGDHALGAEKLLTPPASDQPASKSEFADIRPSGEPIHLQVSSGTLLRLPGPASTVFVSDAEVADVGINPPGFIFLNGKKPGATALYAADRDGNVLLARDIRVEGGPVTIIHGASIGAGGEPPPGPVVLQIPLTAAPAAATH